MARIYQKAKQYAGEDFRKDIRIRQGMYDLMSQNALAEAVGMPRPTLRKRLLEPDTMTFGEFQKLNAAIHPDILAVLPLLGYSEKEILQFLKRNQKAEAESA